MICPNCGSKIPEDSDFCQVCGKRVYVETERKENQTRQKVMAIILAVALLVVGTVEFVYFRGQLQSKDKKIEELNVRLAELEDDYNEELEKYDSLDKLYDDLVDEVLEDHDKARAMDAYIVFVGTDEYYYHKYDCPNLDMSTFWAFNVEAAEENYYPCPYCIE